MSCDNLGTDINKCDPKVKEMKSAKEVCQAVEKKSNMILDAAKLKINISTVTNVTLASEIERLISELNILLYIDRWKKI